MNVSFAPAIEVDGASGYFVLDLPHDHKSDETEPLENAKKRTKGEEFILETHKLQQVCCSLVCLAVFKLIS